MAGAWHDMTGERHEADETPGWATPPEAPEVRCDRGYVKSSDGTCCLVHDRIPTDRTPARGIDLVRIQKHRLRRQREAREAARQAELVREAALALIPAQR